MAVIQSSQVTRLAYEGGGYRWALFRITRVTTSDTYDLTTSFSGPQQAFVQNASLGSTVTATSTGVTFSPATGLNGLAFLIVQGEAPS